MKTKFVLFGWVILCVGVALAAPPAPGPDAALQWDAEAREVALKAGETTAAFAFSVTNVSSADVVLNRVHASCGCTAARLPSMPYTLGAGSNVTLNVEMQLAGKYGLIKKTVTVDSSAGLKTLIVSANIPTEQKTTESK